ncbi:MAG: DNA gyrase inhibitor YacG [Sedimentisphaerales bacterium]|nr:DNA gyrase inhibitor YacG [Sedimentisphaerales bacterium]
MKHRCPICNKTFQFSEQRQPDTANFFPFCSERCKLIDLGLWLDCDYKVISNITSEEIEITTIKSTSEANSQ